MSTVDPFASVNVHTVAVPLIEVGSGQIAAGTPRTGSTEVATLGGMEIGVWEMTTGAMFDIETDEVFIVIDGDATLTLLEGGRDTTVITLVPGTICTLTAGMSTRWDVTRVLRKVYVMSAEPESGATA